MTSAPPASRPALVLAGLSLLAAAAWLVSRVWLGLDFADEMQYYGQIASLVRTGRFFQDDLFLQQLGYVFLLPFFKLHAALFPRQDFLVLFARLLLLAAYAGTGWIFWRAATRAGGFNAAQKIAGLAAFAAWVPFQIFAFSYNTTSYLLIVLLIAGWLARETASWSRYLVTTAVLLTLLTYTHPLAGLALLAAAVAEAAGRRNLRAAGALLGATALGGLAVLGLMVWLHGRDFFTDLLTGITFTRSYGVGAAILRPYHFAGWLLLLGFGGLFILRLRLGRPFAHPPGAGSPPAVRWLALGVMGTAGGALLGPMLDRSMGFFPECALLCLLLVVAASLGPPAARAGPEAWLRGAMLALLIGGGAALLAITLVGLTLVTGYFAITVFGVLLLLLVAVTGTEDRPLAVGLAVIGTVCGAVFGYTSGNGLSSYGVGVAAAIPFLVLLGARSLQSAGIPGAAVAGPGLALLLLAHGVATPYGEQSIRRAFVPVTGVPAFRGIWTSPEKIEAVQRFLPLTAGGALQGRRILVIGPHPWLYFVLGGRPATPVLFMKFDASPEAYEIIAARLFREGPPDVIVLTATYLPRPLAARYQEWCREPYQMAVLTLPADFLLRYEGQTGHAFSPEVYVLSRPTHHP